VAPTALLVAGGTGGHLFPALALREVLVGRLWKVHVATDPRVGELIAGVPAEETHRIPSATIAGGSPVAMARSLATMGSGVLRARKLLQGLKPAIVVGFGGYPTVPPVVAARLSGIPIVLHEQNAVLGRANRLLIRFGATLATGFDQPKGSGRARKQFHVGNPVRSAITDAVRSYEAPPTDGPFRLLVFGGSQGAHAFSELVPGAVAFLPEETRRRLSVVQQARPEDLQATRESYARSGVAATVEPFFTDMGERLAAAHLVISRSGASTIAELAVMGRPAILVPLPHALDQDQAENARVLSEAGGGWLMHQKDITVTTLASRLASLMGWPDELARAAQAAKAEARLDAAERLADVVEGEAAHRQ
jgi:UDP-N-acetylglucosamine--N-acetylmuramyl-(pentapeptide) pyrophosphoryl-undecaprenol N-acetylglucosamine transferase